MQTDKESNTHYPNAWRNIPGLIEELKTGEVTCLPTDTVVPKYNFSKKY